MPPTLLLLGLAIGAWTQATPPKSPVEVSSDQRDNLKGVAAVVVADPLIQDPLSTMIPAESLKAAVELRLRQSDVKVLTIGGKQKAQGALQVKINNLNVKGGYIVFFVSLELQQAEVPINPADPPRIERVITWQAGSLAMISPDNLRVVKDQLDDLVTEFLNDWLAANPKKQVGPLAPSLETQGAQIGQPPRR
jgi:hypothetical protein